MNYFFNYSKMFEQEVAQNQTAQPGQQLNSFNPKNTMLLINLTTQDQEELSEKLRGGVFKRPAKVVDKRDATKSVEIPGIGSEITAAFLIASSDEVNATFPKVEEAELDLTKTLVFNVYPKQLTAVEELAEQETVLISLKPLKANDAVSINFINISKEESVEEEPTQTTDVTPNTEIETSQVSAEAAEKAAAEGAFVPEHAIMSFDSYIAESKKKKWISDLDIKTGALRKELGKKKGEKITAKDLAKVENQLKKKDKDKKKPGLQLNKKDAKKHKRAVLAKNLMKASGSMDESRRTLDWAGETPKHKIVRQWTGVNTDFYLAHKPEKEWNDSDYELFYRLADMVEKEGKIPNFGKRSRIEESRREKIKGAKDQLVKIHEVIERMIKQTSKKSTK